MRYLQDFKEYFTALYHVLVGRLCPHIITKVDCESIFSEARFLYEPIRVRTGIHMYERLVVGKHFLNPIHCSITIDKELFMKIWKDNPGEEEDDLDDRVFLKLEKN